MNNKDKDKKKKKKEANTEHLKKLRDWDRRRNYFVCHTHAGPYSEMKCQQTFSYGKPCLNVCEKCDDIRKMYMLGAYSFDYRPGDFIIRKEGRGNIFNKVGRLDQVFLINRGLITTVAGETIQRGNVLKFVGLIINPESISGRTVVKRSDFLMNRGYRLVRMLSAFHKYDKKYRERLDYYFS